MVSRELGKRLAPGYSRGQLLQEKMCSRSTWGLDSKI